MVCEYQDIEKREAETKKGKKGVGVRDELVLLALPILFIYSTMVVDSDVVFSMFFSQYQNHSDDPPTSAQMLSFQCSFHIPPPPPR